MKKILFTLVLLLTLASCGHKDKTAETTVATVNIDKSKTAVIYFHSNHRCATCMAVEEVAKQSVLNTDVPFYSIDITLESSKALMKEYNIGTQTLLVVKGDKQQNHTSSAFMYARSKPEKVVKELQTAIAKL